MPKLRYLLAAILLCAVCAVAKAAPVNFQVVVIDPPPSNLINDITSDSFTFSFSACVSPGQVPNGTSYLGCFTGENNTGQTLTTLHLFIPTITNGADMCGFSGLGLDIFASVQCNVTSGGYTLDFSGGNIPTANGHAPDDAEFNRDSVFTIAESGIDPSSFPEVTASFNTVPTPEPSSLILLSTGLLSGSGLLLGDWRRRILGKASR
jgi:hypothetical protein